MHAKLSPRETVLETHIDIEGIAPSDLQVAAYIEQLSNSTLLDIVWHWWNRRNTKLEDLRHSGNVQADSDA